MSKMLIAKLQNERKQNAIRCGQIEELAGTGKLTEELDDEYCTLGRRDRELGRLINEASMPKRNICRHTMALVANNID